MRPIIGWFATNHVAANLLMWVLLAAGTTSLFNIYREEFPNMDTGMISIDVPYPGASPAEVELAVCVRVEEAIEGAPGIKRISATAAEGHCAVSAEVEEGADAGKVVDDISSRVDSIDSFPADTEDPQIKELELMTNVLEIVISGPTDERSLKELAWQLREELVDLPGVSQVTTRYIRPYEISVEVSEFTLRRYGLTMQQVANAIAANSLDLPGGSLKTSAGSILLRTRAQAYSARDFENIVVLNRDDGAVVTLGEIAAVRDGFKDTDLAVRFNGEPAVMLVIKRIGQEDAINLASAVKAYLDEYKETRLPSGLKITTWMDESDDIEQRLSVLQRNAVSGLFLVLLSLTLFLRGNVALWVAVGLPVALMGTFFMFQVFGISLSTMSVVAIILVLGILVDDAVVVGERIYSLQQEGIDPETAAIEGTAEVSTPVIFGVLTTVTAFSTFLTIPGGMGSWLSTLGIVVMVALFFSLLESQLILPSHLNRKLVVTGHETEMGWLPNQLQRFAQDVYQPLLCRIIEYRYSAIAATTALLILALGLAASGRVSFQFFPSLVGSRIAATLIMPAGTEVSRMQEKVEQIERAAARLRAELDEGLSDDEPSRIVHQISSIGAALSLGSMSNGTNPGSNYAEVGIEVLDVEEYDLDPHAIAKRWRQLTGPIPGAVELTFDASTFSFGAPIDIELRGKNTESLRKAAARLKEKLRDYPGVFDITDTFRAGKPELQFKLKPEALSLGLTTQQMASQVREAFYGLEVQRIQRGNDDMRVMVRLPETERRSIGDLENMIIRTGNGDEIPFSSVAEVVRVQGFSRINREDGYRIVSVRADVDRAVITPEVVLQSLINGELKAIQQEIPGVTVSFGGEAEEFAEMTRVLVQNLILAMFVIYALLAIPLKSYTQPLVIMSVIPFGVLGAMLGHFIVGIQMIIFSLIGIVALGGIVINTSLVLVDKINRELRSGAGLHRAAVTAGVSRFRPIVLTSLTTFVGLLPLIFNSSLTTFMFVPLATSLAFGVLITTFINLLLVPALYVVLDDALAAKDRLLGRKHHTVGNAHG